MAEQATVSREQWLEARRAFMKKEKEFTKLRDELSIQRRQLPRVKIHKDYRFIGNKGELSLGDLFGNHSQLAVYHFMFGPDWEEGCPSCSFWADNYNGIEVHLAQRDIKLIAISRAPLEKLNAYKERMGWTFDWYSSLNNDFNFDFKVSFTDAEKESGEPVYNFDTLPFQLNEAPGFSVFSKDEQGNNYHTYSTFASGLDSFNAAYHIMDMMPKGRDEGDLPHPMGWLRRHDQYED
jgi:predicted dithiol-disulfide oxidoreductase (DUF899 family)